MATTTDQLLSELKRQARDTWRAGDYDAVAQGIWQVGELIVRRVGVAADERVLDVACGTGNAAIRAALAGGRVTALDLTPELLQAGRRRAAEAGVEVEWIEGDAEALPFSDGSFDVVLSTFGVMFAPRHAVATAEMARVLRPGGRIGLATWPPDGAVADMFGLVASRLPPAAEIVEPPLAWGNGQHVRCLFAASGVEVTSERQQLKMDRDVRVEQAAEFYLRSFGPLVKAREVLEPEGRWQALAEELAPVIRRMVTEPASYLVITGSKSGGQATNRRLTPGRRTPSVPHR